MTHHHQPESTTLICPKCQGRMSTYERNGVLVDQCHYCRGIFLDRGEIERLIEAGHPAAEDEDVPGRSTGVPNLHRAAPPRRVLSRTCSF